MCRPMDSGTGKSRLPTEHSTSRCLRAKERAMLRTLILTALSAFLFSGCKDPAKAAKEQRKAALIALMHGQIGRAHV